MDSRKRLSIIGLALLPGGLLFLAAYAMWANRAAIARNWLLWLASLGGVALILADRLAHLMGLCLGF